MRSPLRLLAAACIVAAGIFVVVLLYAFGLTPAQVTERDYIQYWAAGQQLVHHADPYDFQAIYRMERQNGMQTSEPRISFSPPVALEFDLPLGWVSAKTGLILWLLAELACVLVSIWLVWRLNGKHDTRLHLLGLAFAPVVACQMAGQIGVFFLLCLVLFLEFHRRRPFLAGVALMPFALKPHLFVPFAIALAIWCMVQKKIPLLMGGLCALAASCVVSLAIDPHAWAEYSRMTSSFSIADWFVPTVGMALRDVDRSCGAMDWLSPRRGGMRLGRVVCVETPLALGLDEAAANWSSWSPCFARRTRGLAISACFCQAILTAFLALAEIRPRCCCSC